MKTSTEEAREYVLAKEEFRTSYGTIYGTHNLAANTYIVYSYGSHFPMYVFDYTAEQWYGNSEKYSRTTTRHQSICRPPQVFEWYDTKIMQQIASRGIAGAVKLRMAA